MNTLILKPTDVLFFRDGRPMEGSLAGHSMAWPLPDVTNHALHAALHRSGLEGHSHRRGRSANYSDHRDRRYGSLVTAGPFPFRMPDKAAVPGNHADGANWFFPTPRDLLDNTLSPALLPSSACDWPGLSSLPAPLRYAVANRLPPSKDNPTPQWLCKPDFERYINGVKGEQSKIQNCAKDSAIADMEQTIGIAIDPDTGTTGHGEAEGKIYSAQYLRLREEWCLGLFAETAEKTGSNGDRVDLIQKLIPESGQIVVGGQQRTCRAFRFTSRAPLPLPAGKTGGFNTATVDGQTLWLVKWVLLSPAIWPCVEPGKSNRGTERQPHPGGWLPNWIHPQNGKVLLHIVPPEERRRRRSLNYNSKGYNSNENATAIDATLVAAVVPKPIVVTGWALPNAADNTEGGAKSTHLAVPAGAVYYFTAASEQDAQRLAAVLNWHGDDPQGQSVQTIKNRRSTLLGEKGYGLGVCGTWQFIENVG